MIYTISEYMATAIDSIVLICFLAYTLSFKKPKQKLNIVTSIAFMLLFFSCVTIFNNITIAEGIYAAFYFLIFFMYCRISLKGKWWQQLLLVTIELAVLFLVNAVITIISASVLKSDYFQCTSYEESGKSLPAVFIENFFDWITFPYHKRYSKTKNCTPLVTSIGFHYFHDTYCNYRDHH